jgi:acyl-coenzyme A synthetase/AMP-(fatty) acid ligase
MAATIVVVTIVCVFLLFLQATVDQAVAGLEFVEHVLVQERTGAAVVMGPKDVPLLKAMAQARPYCPIVPVDSEDPLFIL